MKIMKLSDLYAKSARELEGMKEEIRKDIGACEQRRRRNYAAVADIRKVQAQRRIMRPNL
jgi:hypothetical protein